MAASESVPTRSLDKKERAAMVQQAVMALGDRQRMALMLSRFEGLSYQEIADAMNLSVKAVKSLLSRARVNLKTYLEPYLEEGIPPAVGAIAENEKKKSTKLRIWTVRTPTGRRLIYYSEQLRLRAGIVRCGS